MISEDSYNILCEQCEDGFDNIYGEMAINLVIRNQIIEKFSNNLKHFEIDGQIESPSAAGYLVTVIHVLDGKDIIQRLHFSFDLLSIDCLSKPTIEVYPTIEG
jgi:hypothetical protein